MSKVPLIIKREYLTRVKKKSFIIMSILGPVLIGGIIALFMYIAMNQGDKISKIKVIDETGTLIHRLPQSKTILFFKDTLPLAVSREIFNANEYFGILYIPLDALHNPGSITLYTEKQPSLSVVSGIESSLQKEIEEFKLSEAGIRKQMLDSIKTRVSLVQKPVSGKEEEKEFFAGINAGVGFACALLIYLFVFMYGVQVMRGVMEEKTSRIVEVIISSVKPFQLMMGKIIGIALVGLTQFLIWVILTAAVTSGVSAVMLGEDADAKEKMEKFTKPENAIMDSKQNNSADIAEADLKKMLNSINLPKLLLTFVFYFLGGYLLYASLFAAIGAAVDTETDTQQFMLPITLPLVFAYIVSTIVMSNPESSLGYWFSIIPFTSPVVMMVRMPFDPPMADILISMLLLIAGFILTTWLASKIYRTGILMYGKKASYKEIGKWLFYK